MLKPSSFARKLLTPATLLLTGIFLHSCSEEVPILQPLNGSTSSKSTVVLNVKNTTYTINNIKPASILFAVTGTDPKFPLYKQYGFDATNNSQTDLLDYAVTFHTDTVGSKKYTLEISQFTLNKKTYSTANIYGNAVFKVDKLDAANNTTSGSFNYFVYDDILSPTDSIYVSGTFNIVK